MSAVRRRRSFPCLAGLCLLASSGCATATPGTRDAATITIMTGGGDSYEVRRGADLSADQRVEVSAADAWSVLPDVYRGLGVEPDVVDREGRSVGASAHRFSGRVLNRPASDFFECGLDPGLNRPLADQGPITARVATTVVEGSAGVLLRTHVEGTARQTGGNAGTAACRSTGLLEVLIGQMVQRAARPPA